MMYYPQFSTKETDMISEKVMPFVYYMSTGKISKMTKNYVLPLKHGAPRETRTPDPLITNQLLYQLCISSSWLFLK